VGVEEVERVVAAVDREVPVVAGCLRWSAASRSAEAAHSLAIQQSQSLARDQSTLSALRECRSERRLG
jgi:hypothetical protein